MSIVDKATETQLHNIQTKTGQTLDGLFALIRASGLTKYGQIRDMLKSSLGLGHGDANLLVTVYLKPAQASAPAAGDPLAEIYAGPKAALRPIHEKVMLAISAFGPFEIAPKKGYVSLRRKKQFATLGPTTRSRVEVGLNMKGVTATPRLIELPAGGMCQYKVNLADVAEVDAELIAWMRLAYAAAG